MTQSILLYDCMVLQMVALPGTPEYTWREPKPCSDKVTRLLGKGLFSFLIFFNFFNVFSCYHGRGEGSCY